MLSMRSLLTNAIRASAALAFVSSSAVAHIKILALPDHSVQPGKFAPTPSDPGLYPLNAEFVALPPLDGDNKDAWPCVAGHNDCSSIASGGIVVGQPSYVWPLSSCNGNMPTSPNCGQINWFYHDLTNDSVDHLFVSITVKQGRATILSTGSVDFGPNPYAGGWVYIYDDTAFGTLGATHKGNGFCAGSTDKCVDPVAGPATATMTTTVGSYTMKQKFEIVLQ